jgi:hypothetical protein
MVLRKTFIDNRLLVPCDAQAIAGSCQRSFRTSTVNFRPRRTETFKCPLTSGFGAFNIDLGCPFSGIQECCHADSQYLKDPTAG